MSRRPFLHPGEPLRYVPTPDDVARFMVKVKLDKSTPKVNGSHCWQWQACGDEKGYGCFKLGGKRRWAHRVAYSLFKARPLRLGDDVDHVCESRSCVCPRHLRATTRALNSSRGGKRRHAVAAADGIPF